MVTQSKGNGFGVNLVSFFKGNFGLSSYARQFAQLMKRRNIPFKILNVDYPSKETAHSDYQEFDGDFLSPGESLPFDINFYIFGVDRNGYDFIRGNYNLLEFDRKINIYLPFWELFELPDHFSQLVPHLDLLVAPTRFVQGILMHSCSKPVEYLPSYVFLPDLSEVKMPPIRKDREFIFYYSFDMCSSTVRKNPECLINAFLKVFQGKPEVKLVLKVNYDKQFPQYADTINNLMNQLAPFSNVQILHEYLSYAETMYLMSQCDVYVSPHHSEGLGLGLMEAMLLGKSVIGTGWGGNMDFMNHSNALLIDFTLEPVNCPMYQAMINSKPSQWAVPSQSHLEKLMKCLYENEPFRQQLTIKATEDMKHREQAFLHCDLFESIKNYHVVKQQTHR